MTDLPWEYPGTECWGRCHPACRNPRGAVAGAAVEESQDAWVGAGLVAVGVCLLTIHKSSSVNTVCIYRDVSCFLLAGKAIVQSSES